MCYDHVIINLRRGGSSGDMGIVMQLKVFPMLLFLRETPIPLKGTVSILLKGKGVQSDFTMGSSKTIRIQVLP
jgi:hypothetical protein